MRAWSTIFFGEMNHLAEPRLEIVEGTDINVDAGAKIEALERRIGEGPVGTVEDVAVIHHVSDEPLAFRRGPLLQAGAEKNGLPGVGITDPFVEDKRAQEFFPIDDFVQQQIGNEIVHHHLGGISGISGSEVPTGFDGQVAGAELNVNCGVGGQEAGGQVYHGGLGRRDLQVMEEGGGQPFIDQNPAMLGIIAELDDVEVAIVAFEEVGLRSTAHFSDQTPGVDGHRSKADASLAVAGG